jgi:hypothetical protein
MPVSIVNLAGDFLWNQFIAGTLRVCQNRKRHLQETCQRAWVFGGLLSSGQRPPPLAVIDVLDYWRFVIMARTKGLNH